MTINRKICLLLFFICFLFTFSQQKIDQKRKVIFDSLEKRGLTNASLIFNNGKEMLNYAQTDEDFARAYLIMGDGKYKDGSFLSAIKLFETADSFAKKTSHTRDLQIAINSLLMYSYRYAGLLTESDAVLSKINTLANLEDNGEAAQVLQATAFAHEIDANFCKAIPYREKELKLYQSNFNFNNEIQKKSMLIFANTHMAFLQIKCGNHDNALKKIDIAEGIYEQLGKKKPLYYIENYYLVKALISLFEKDDFVAKEWFEKSYESAKQTQNKATIKKILIEMQKSGIYETAAEKNKIYEGLLHIQNFQTEMTKKTAENEILKKNEVLKRERKNLIAIISISATLFLILMSTVIYLKKRNKKIYANYLKLGKETELKEEQKKEVNKEGFRSKQGDLDVNIEILENENNIVKQLSQLEEKLFFTDKNMSATQLAAMLKVTPRNLSYIIKKYRNDDFYNYLNNLRVDYFIRILKENTKYRNYKIAVLSEMCGYNSYSQFAVNFKAKAKISPSQYISLLRKEEN